MLLAHSPSVILELSILLIPCLTPYDTVMILIME